MIPNLLRSCHSCNNFLPYSYQVLIYQGSAMRYFILVPTLAPMSSAGKMSSSVHFLLLASIFLSCQCFLAVYLPFLGDNCKIHVLFCQRVSWFVVSLPSRISLLSSTCIWKLFWTVWIVCFGRKWQDFNNCSHCSLFIPELHKSLIS